MSAYPSYRSVMPAGTKETYLAIKHLTSPSRPWVTEREIREYVDNGARLSFGHALAELKKQNEIVQDGILWRIR